MLARILILLVLVVPAHAENRLTAEAIHSSGPHGTGAEGTVEGDGTTGGDNTSFYSYLFSSGWTGGKPLAAMDYTFGNSHTRHTVVRGELTNHNGRLDLVGADHIVHPSDSSELRFYSGFYGAQYNWLIGAQGAWRVLPLSVTFEQRFGDRLAVKASASHAWLMPMEDAPEGKRLGVKGEKSFFPRDDFEASLKGFLRLSGSTALSAGAVIEDTRYPVLKDVTTANPYVLYSSDRAVTGTAGLTVVW
jgi:hypothetical protein